MSENSTDKPFLIAQSNPSPAGLQGVMSTDEMLHRYFPPPPKKAPAPPPPAPASSGYYKPYDFEGEANKTAAWNTPIQVAPGLDPSLPPPPRNHTPDLTWMPVNGKWVTVPFPAYNDGGAYMYVENVWQYVEHPKHHQYALGQDGIWRFQPEKWMSAQDKAYLMYANHAGPAFDQTVYDLLHSKALGSFYGSTKDYDSGTVHDFDNMIAQGNAGWVAAEIAGGMFMTFLIWPILAYILFKIVKARKRRARELAAARAAELGAVHGTSRYMRFDELVALGMISIDQSRGLIVGAYWEANEKSGEKRPYPIRFIEDGHLLTFAPTGAGKGVSAVIPNLLAYPGSVVCIDPKGENAGKTARRRREMGQSVLILDPFRRLPKEKSVGYNPLASLDPWGQDAADDAALLAECLVPPDGSNNPFWRTEARALVAGMMLYAIVAEVPENRHICRVRDYLNLAPDRWQALLEHMSKHDNPLVSAAGNRALQKHEREAGIVLSEAQSCTDFMDSPAIRASLASNDWDMKNLKHTPTTVYLVLPAEQLNNHSKWLRLLISQMLTAMARDQTRPEHDVLFLLDEFAALGHLSAVETAMGLMRGYGVKLWPILQDLPQLQAAYRDKWQSFIANAGAIQFFGINDKTTAEYASSMMGQITVQMELQNVNAQGVAHQEGLVSRALIMPDEIQRMPSWDQLLKVRGKFPIYSGRTQYFDKREAYYAGLADPWP